jgi:PEP-CTERM motif
MSELVDLSIDDRDIHSGVFQTNPFGVSLDNYILQGGDPFGRDTQDAYEVAQTPGPFQFSEVVPEPASILLITIGIAGLAVGRRFRA